MLRRILAEFQTRKAHRVCVRDKDLLKYLLGFVMVVAGYMSAWTAVVMDNWEKGHSILEVAVTPSSLRYLLCRALWWDYVTEFGEPRRRPPVGAAAVIEYKSFSPRCTDRWGKGCTK